MKNRWDSNAISVGLELVQELNPHRHSRLGDDCDADTRVRRAQSALAEAISSTTLMAGWADNWEAISGEASRGFFETALRYSSFDFLGTLRYAIRDPRTKDLAICKAAAPLIQDWSLDVYKVKGFLAMSARLCKKFGDLKFDDDEDKVCQPDEVRRILAVLDPIYDQLIDLLEGHAWDFQRLCDALMTEGGAKRRSKEEVALLRPRYPIASLFNKVQRRLIYDRLAPLRKMRQKKVSGPAHHRTLSKVKRSLKPIFDVQAPWIAQMGYEVDDICYHLTDVVAHQPLEVVMA